MKDETIGGYAREILLSQPGLTNQEVLDKVKAKFKDARTGLASIAWYKADIKRRNLKAPVVKDRTLDVVRGELEEAKENVLALEAELASLEEAGRDEELKQLKQLATKYGEMLPEDILTKIKALGEGEQKTAKDDVHRAMGEGEQKQPEASENK